MQHNTHSLDNGGQNIKSKRDKIPAKWDVLNLTSTWFLTNDGTPVLVDGSLPNGASDDQWRELISRTGVRVALDRLNSHWGQYARCAFLNWCEVNLPVEKRPKLFHSREEAISILFDESKTESKRIEISDEP